MAKITAYDLALAFHRVEPTLAHPGSCPDCGVRELFGVPLDQVADELNRLHPAPTTPPCIGFPSIIGTINDVIADAKKEQGNG